MRVLIVLALFSFQVLGGFAQTFSFTADTVARYGESGEVVIFHAVFENFLNDTQSIHFHVDVYDFPDTNWTIGICNQAGCFPPGVTDVNYTYEAQARDTLVSFDVCMTEVGDSGRFSATLTAAVDPDHPQTVHFTIYKESLDVVWRLETIPEDDGLMFSYPNPFNSETTLEFSILRSEATELVICDLLGREVARILDGERLNPGTHRLRWSGTNLNGVPLSSGVYFARLSVGDEFHIRRLYLLR
ncbi:MAG: T9SS type A sorting domain-containing protein [bacterium]